MTNNQLKIKSYPKAKRFQLTFENQDYFVLLQSLRIYVA